MTFQAVLARVKNGNDDRNIGELYGPTCEIEMTKSQAMEYKAALVERYIRLAGMEKSEAERIVNSNIGYYCGYYDSATMARVHALFCCEHPIFGKSIPTPQQAFEAGKKLGGEQ